SWQPAGAAPGAAREPRDVPRPARRSRRDVDRAQTASLALSGTTPHGSMGCVLEHDPLLCELVADLISALEVACGARLVARHDLRVDRLVALAEAAANVDAEHTGQLHHR